MFSWLKYECRVGLVIFGIICLVCSQGFSEGTKEELKQRLAIIHGQRNDDVNNLMRLEAEYLKLLKDYNSPEDKGEIYAQIALTYSERGYPLEKRDARLPKTIEYCKRALEKPLDAATACRMNGAWAGALMVKHFDSNEAEWAKMRQEAIVLCLKGLKIAMDNNAHAEFQESPPAVNLYTADGPDHADLMEQHRKELAAREEWELKHKLHSERWALTQMCITLYVHEPYNTKELQDFAERELRDYPVVRKELIAKVESRIKEQTPQNKGIQGRFTFGEGEMVDGTRIIKVFLELRNASDNNNPICLLYDPRRSVRAQLFQADGQPVLGLRPGFDFKGQLPSPSVICFSRNETIKLDLTAPKGLFGIPKDEKAFIGLQPSMFDSMWIIKKGDNSEYCLGGTFTAEAPKEPLNKNQPVWTGTIEIPRTKVDVLNFAEREFKGSSDPNGNSKSTHILKMNTEDFQNAVAIAVSALQGQSQYPAEDYKFTSAQQIIVEGKYIWRITFKPVSLLPKDPSKGIMTMGGEIFVNVDLSTKKQSSMVENKLF